MDIIIFLGGKLLEILELILSLFICLFLDGVSLCRLGWRAVARSQLMHLLPPWFKPFSCLSLPGR